MMQAITPDVRFIEAGNKVTVLAVIQDLMNKSEQRREFLIERYAKAVLRGEEMAELLVELAGEEATKIKWYRRCTELLQQK